MPLFAANDDSTMGNFRRGRDLPGAMIGALDENIGMISL